MNQPHMPIQLSHSYWSNLQGLDPLLPLQLEMNDDGDDDADFCVCPSLPQRWFMLSVTKTSPLSLLKWKEIQVAT